MSKDSKCNSCSKPVPDDKEFQDKVVKKMEDGYHYKQALEIVLNGDGSKKSTK